MKQLVILVAALSCLAAPHARAEPPAAGLHDCAKEPTATLDGAGMTVKFIGVCDKIAINGSGGTITIESVKHVAIAGSGNTVDIGATDKIAVVGAGNKVTYKKGLSGAKPKVAVMGADNKVSKVK